MSNTADRIFCAVDLLGGWLLLAGVTKLDLAIICLNASSCKRIRLEMDKIGVYLFSQGLSPPMRDFRLWATSFGWDGEAVDHFSVRLMLSTL